MSASGILILAGAGFMLAGTLPRDAIDAILLFVAGVALELIAMGVMQYE